MQVHALHRSLLFNRTWFSVICPVVSRKLENKTKQSFFSSQRLADTELGHLKRFTTVQPKVVSATQLPRLFTLNIVARYNHYITPLTKQPQVSQQNDTVWENADDYRPYQHVLIKFASESHTAITGVSVTSTGEAWDQFSEANKDQNYFCCKARWSYISSLVLNFNSWLRLSAESTCVHGHYSQHHCAKNTSETCV